MPPQPVVSKNLGNLGFLGFLHCFAMIVLGFLENLGFVVFLEGCISDPGSPGPSPVACHGRMVWGSICGGFGAQSLEGLGLNLRVWGSVCGGLGA